MRSDIVSTRLHPDIRKACERYSVAEGHPNMAQTYRELITDAIYHKTEKPYASLVRQQVHEELDSFRNGIRATIELMAVDTLSSLDDSLGDSLDVLAKVAEACLIASAQAASAAEGGERTPDQVVVSALESAYGSTRNDFYADSWEEE